MPSFSFKTVLSADILRKIIENKGNQNLSSQSNERYKTLIGNCLLTVRYQDQGRWKRPALEIQ